MKEKLNQIMKDHGIFGEEVETILEVVQDMLTCAADDLKENNPEAVNSIDELEQAARTIWNLYTDLQYEEDGEK